MEGIRYSTFLVRLIQSGLIDPKDLKRKYHEELHANEIVLLPYYIAAVNIEEAYHDAQQSRNRQIAQDYEPFEGIVLTDTFRLLEKQFAEMSSSENSKRARRQKRSPIRVIIGNPPYSAGQKSENDANKNTKYEQLDEKIRTTYAAASTAVLKNSLYDSYIRAFRWATDRICDKGVVCYVTNSGFIDSNAADGFRKCLAEEFTDIYVFNLRGGIRGRAGDAAKRERQNVFPIMTGVAITLLIKNPAKKGNPGTIHYYDIGDYHNREKKLQIIADANGLLVFRLYDKRISSNFIFLKCVR